MVYFTPPEAPPVIIYQTPVSTEQVPLPNNEIRRVEYGVCSALGAIEGNSVLDERQTKNNSLFPIMYAVDLLSKNKRNELNTSKTADVFKWYDSWAASLKISILRSPAHAQLGDLKINRSLAIVPNTDYLGKDRVDVLVEGKDDLGRPFKLTLRYYLSVLSKAEEQRIYNGKDLPFKELCGKNHNRWRISGLGESGFIGLENGDLAAWQRSAQLSALIANANQSLTSFTDLPATAVG